VFRCNCATSFGGYNKIVVAKEPTIPKYNTVKKLEDNTKVKYTENKL
jgi:hypothetical protein